MEKYSNAASRSKQSPTLVEVDPGEVHVCDLRGKCLQLEDLENALRLWRQPIVLMAGRNALNRLPTNAPSSILYLDISVNKLTTLEGFSALPSLRELDVSHNDIRSMLGLVSNTNLRVLRISHNCIRRIEGLHQQKLLEEVDLSHNLLNTAADVRALSLNPAVRRLRMKGNPFCATGVQHGSYVIAMQYLLPGMSLLDGKPLRGPSSLRCPPPLPPPPPRVRRTLDHGVGGPIQPTIAFESGITDCDSPNDKSISRRWCDLAISAGREPPPIPEREQGGRTRAKRGSGGPTVDSGSYLDFYLFELQRKQHSVSISPAAAITSIGKRRVKTPPPPRRREERMRAVNTVPASPKRKPAGGQRAGDRGTDEIRGCVRGTYGANHATPLSPSAYRRLTRAERVKAHSLALKHVRKEDAFGRVSVRTNAHGVKKSAGHRSPRAARSPRAKPDADSRLSSRSLNSPSRHKNKAISAETPRSSKSQTFQRLTATTLLRAPQALEAGKHTRRVPMKKEGKSGCTSNAGMVSQNSPTSKVKRGRHLGIRTRAQNTSPGARRFTDRTRQPDSHASDAWISSNHAPSPVTRKRDARRSGGLAAAKSRSSSGQGTARVRHSSAAATGHRNRATQNRFRITLGHRSGCAPWVEAPRSSRCTPREDAKLWSERNSNWHGASDFERAVDNQSENLSRWCSDQGVGATLAPTRDECPGSRNFHRPDRSPWDTTPFVSPLSKTGLLHRRSCPQYPWTSSSTMPGACSAEVETEAASREHWSAANRTPPQATVNQEWTNKSLMERSSSPRVLSKDRRRVKLDEGLTEGCLKYDVDEDSHTPQGLLDKRGMARHGLWAERNEPLATSPISFPISPISRENTRRAVNHPGREPHGKRATVIPESSDVADSAQDLSPELSGWSGVGRNDHTDRKTDQTTVSSQWQQHDAERQEWQRPSPPVQLVTLESVSSPVKIKMVDNTTNTEESGKCNIYDAVASETAREYSCPTPGSSVFIHCDDVEGEVDGANKKKEEDKGEKEAFRFEDGDPAHRQHDTEKDGRTSSLDTEARNTITRLDKGGCSPGVKIDKEEVRRDDSETVIREAERALSDERGLNRTENSKNLVEDGPSIGSGGVAGQSRSLKPREEHTEKAGQEAVTLDRIENEIKNILGAIMKQKGGDMGVCSPVKSITSDPGPRYAFDKEEVRRDNSETVIREAGRALSKGCEPDKEERHAEACKELVDEWISIGSAIAACQESGQTRSQQAREGYTKGVRHENVTLVGLENEIQKILGAILKEKGGGMSAYSPAESVASDPGPRQVIDKEEVRQDDPEPVTHEVGKTSADQTGRPAESCKESAEEELPMGSAAATGQESGRAGSQQVQEGHIRNVIAPLARLENEIMDILGSIMNRRGSNMSACSPVKSVASDPAPR